MGPPRLWEDLAEAAGADLKAPLLIGLGALAVLALARPTSSEAGRPPEVASRPKTGKILLLGDSLMVGAAPYVQTPHVALAKIGKTLGEMLAELKNVPADSFDGVAISGGLNDLAMPSRGDAIAMRAAALWDVAKQKGWKVGHLALTPFGGGSYAARLSETERRNANAALRAASSGLVSVLPADDLLDDPSDSSRLLSEFASPDGLHLNARGYALLGGLIDEWSRTRL